VRKINSWSERMPSEARKSRAPPRRRKMKRLTTFSGVPLEIGAADWIMVAGTRRPGQVLEWHCRTRIAGLQAHGDQRGGASPYSAAPSIMAAMTTSRPVLMPRRRAAARGFA